MRSTVGLVRSVFLALLCATAACSTPTRPTPRAEDRPHLGDAWFTERALQLGITPEQARERDAALPVDAPPDQSWDPNMQREASAVWQEICARCHGVDGRGEGVTAKFNKPPRAFGGMGMRMGFTFGRNKMRAGVFKKIMEGGGEMPPQAGVVSREQAWALATYVESL